MGMATFQKICQWPAPSMAAASSRLLGMVSMNWRSRKVPKALNAAGRISPA